MLGLLILARFQELIEAPVKKVPGLFPKQREKVPGLFSDG
jgi:hypothetical protein